jgi:hypothetical protein
VQGDGADLHEVEQRRQVTADESWRGLSGLRLDLLDAHCRRVLRGVLLEEGRPADPVGISLEREWPVRKDREQDRGDARVVAHEPALGDAIAWEEDLVQTGHAKRALVGEGDLPVPACPLDARELLLDLSGLRSHRRMLAAQS